MICWAPLLLLGYSWTLAPDWHRVENVDAPVVEVQSCATGFGVHVKGSAAPWVAGGIHYGLTWAVTPSLAVTLQPQVGLGYSNTVAATGMRSIGRVEAGLLALVQYGRTALGLEYTHLSNGQGWTRTNVSVDVVAGLVGWGF